MTAPRDGAWYLLEQIPGPLLDWYHRSARVLPWRSHPTPYRVWISEIMLQQTRVEAAKPYYLRFLEALPDVPALAACPEDTLLKLWEGLGYYSRARNLQKAARLVMERHGGELPASFQALRALPGVGDYTAGAIASIAFGLPCPAVDGNVLRVTSRVTASYEDISGAKIKVQVGDLIRKILPPQPGDFNQALMELGACVCLPNGEPLCGDCPLGDICQAKKLGLQGELPVKAPKKARRVQQLTVLLLRDEKGRLALRRRPAAGLLAGMWEPVNLPGRLTSEEVAAAVAGMGLTPLEVAPLPSGRHVFTHVEWEMTAWAVRAAGAGAGVVWAAPGELEVGYPLPSAFRQAGWWPSEG